MKKLTGDVNGCLGFLLGLGLGFFLCTEILWSFVGPAAPRAERDEASTAAQHAHKSVTAKKSRRRCGPLAAIDPVELCERSELPSSALC